jgi:dTDP-4-dehydrorhamnose 3,5-epimerase
MKVVDCAIAEVKILEPRVFGDDRGFFMETWNRNTFEALGLDLRFVQDNHSRSARGVLRGLHYQLPQPQGKLVRVVRGRAYDVAVDLRRHSPTFGRWVGSEISAANKRMLWVPAGFAHGFLSLEDDTDFIYKCTDFYAPEHERTILWNDPAIGIEWPLQEIGTPHLSAKDVTGTPFRQAAVYP